MEPCAVTPRAIQGGDRCHNCNNSLLLSGEWQVLTELSVTNVLLDTTPTYHTFGKVDLLAELSA